MLFVSVILTVLLNVMKKEKEELKNKQMVKKKRGLTSPVRYEDVKDKYAEYIEILEKESEKFLKEHVRYWERKHKKAEQKLAQKLNKEKKMKFYS